MSDNDPQAGGRQPQPARGWPESWNGPLNFWYGDGGPGFPGRPGSGAADQSAESPWPGQDRAPRFTLVHGDTGWPVHGDTGWPGGDPGHPGQVPPHAIFPGRAGDGQLESIDPEVPDPLQGALLPPGLPGLADHSPEAPGAATGPPGYLWEELGGSPRQADPPGARGDLHRPPAPAGGWGPPEFPGVSPETNGTGQWPEQPQSTGPHPRRVPGRPAVRRFSGQRRQGDRVRLLRAVITVAVAALLISVAALLLTSRTSHPATASPAAGQAAAPARATSTFPGFPGQQGSVSVTAAASAGDVQVAVGTADGHPAIWRRTGSGTWAIPAGTAAVLSQPGGVSLAGITHGPAGWLAVGEAGSGQPVLLTSPDGAAWQHAADPTGVFTGPGLAVTAAAAGHGGYVVTGTQEIAGVHYAAMWWSPDLRIWARAGNTIMSTVSSPGSGMAHSWIYDVTTTAAGWVAVGVHNGCHTAWLSTDGQHWQSYDIPKPDGTTNPDLREIAVRGSLIVAAGDIGAGGGRFPLAVVSADGGKNWQATSLGGPGSFAGPQGTVTALTVTGTGFLAAGLEGPPGAQHAVTWTSVDGITWSAPVRAGSSTQKITVLSSAGGVVTQISSLSGAHGTRAVEMTSPASS